MPAIKTSIVEACIFRTRSQELEVLVLKRSKDRDIYPGIWQILTGRVEQDEISMQAIMREIKEETGLTPTSLWTAPQVLSFFDPITDRIILAPLFIAQVDPGDRVTLSHEHSEFAWVSPDKAKELVPWKGQHDAIDTTVAFLTGNRLQQELAKLSANSFSGKG